MLLYNLFLNKRRRKRCNYFVSDIFRWGYGDDFRCMITQKKIGSACTCTMHKQPISVVVTREKEEGKWGALDFR
jgi:hypothetical protein